MEFRPLSGESKPEFWSGFDDPAFRLADALNIALSYSSQGGEEWTREDWELSARLR